MYHNNIKQYRKEKNMNLEQMAKRVGISTGYLCHLERETRKNPSTKIMGKIAEILEKSVVEIFFEE
ncbi:MAG: helix-turn-helix transcriptional regulator [Clostridia bacterium]|jgi:DNA-binding XRE family transcriptional regulator|nr:helix-turn-helix transcriptional regulator [Clostridia bacterium]